MEFETTSEHFPYSVKLKPTGLSCILNDSFSHACLLVSCYLENIFIYWIMQIFQVLTHLRVCCKEVLYPCFSFYHTDYLHMKGSKLIILQLFLRQLKVKYILLFRLHTTELDCYYCSLVPLPWFVLSCQQFYSALFLYHQWKCQHNEKCRKPIFDLIDPLKTSGRLHRVHKSCILIHDQFIEYLLFNQIPELGSGTILSIGEELSLLKLRTWIWCFKVK